MIDTIALYTGYFIIISLTILILSIVWYYIILNISNGLIEVKAIVYAIASNMKKYKDNKSLISQISLEPNREWNIYFKGKVSTWRCIKVIDEIKR